MTVSAALVESQRSIIEQVDGWEPVAVPVVVRCGERRCNRGLGHVELYITQRDQPELIGRIPPDRILFRAHAVSHQMAGA